ncbi:MAG: hypothetical protein KatS3mg083_024 [Candidatus Dojkabacteria bacterium]|nr:MAG: hypothetical protein KatS3mg083_024 [Candidatus Dojkabacteria bacterium]
MRHIVKILIVLSTITIFVFSSTTLLFAQTPTPTPTSTPTPTPTHTYSFQAFVDKTSVKPGETFTVTINVENTGTTTINNFEIRLPFIRNIQEVNFELESPSFNKILDSFEFPTGFNSRSWLINTFSPGLTKTFSITYKVLDSAQDENGLIAKFTLPITWVDPAGLDSNREITLNSLRADIYINKMYKNSNYVELPKLDYKSNPFVKVKLSDKFVFDGSRTTDLSKLDPQTLNAVNNFKLETQHVLLEWQKPIDLSSSEAVNVFSNLDQYLDSSPAKVVYKKRINFFDNIPVKVTFKQMYFVFEPKIKIGNDIEEFTKLQGNLNRSAREVSIYLDQIKSALLIPDIKTDKSIYETNEQDIEIKAYVSDPNARVTYKIDKNSQENQIFVVDIDSGEFTIPIQLNRPSLQIEITATIHNDQSFSKVIIVKSTTKPEITPTEITSEQSTISMPVNQLTIILLIVAVSILSIIISIVFYLLYKGKKRKTKSSKDVKLDSLTVNSLFSRGTDDEHLFPTVQTPQQHDKSKQENKKINLLNLSQNQNSDTHKE